MIPDQSEPLYEHADAALLRATAFPPGFTATDWPDVSAHTEKDVERWHAWLRQTWGQERLAAAIEVASPDLARGIEAVCGGKSASARDMRRMVLTLGRYILRMNGRATPFGLFAGVAVARFDAAPSVRLGDCHRAVARADAAWLAQVIAVLESCPQLLARLPVVASNLCFARGDRLVLPCQVRAGAAEGTPGAPAEISVRRTAAVELVMRMAVTPKPCGELANMLAAAFPGTSRPLINAVIADLLAHRLLLSSLRPPMTTGDALGHVLAELGAAGAGQITSAGPLLRELREIHRAIRLHDQAESPSAATAIRRATAVRMRELARGVPQPLTVDLRLDCEVVLPELVAREAALAASALTRLTAHPSGAAAWRDYHARFLDWYGTGCLVPVRELVSAETGLGLPAGYLGSQSQAPAVPLSARDARLLRLAQLAAIDGVREIVLDAGDIASLAAGDAAQMRVLPHAEIVFQVQAPSLGALASGDFRLVVTGTSRSAGTMTGRFLDLLGDADRARMIAVYARLAGRAGGVPVQLSAPPLYPRAENVARIPVLVHRVIRLAEHRGTTGPGPEQVVPLDDIGVASDGQRLRAWSISRRCPLDVVVFHAVDFRAHTMPVARFLCEVGRAQAAVYASFDWGAAARLPFLPRVRYGRTVLAPARWNLTSADLPPRTASWPDWAVAAAKERERLRVPTLVCLCEQDRRLRLDIGQPAHLMLLRAHLDRTGHAELQEAADPAAHGWLGGRAHEIVVPVAAVRGTSAALRHERSPACVSAAEDAQLPGASRWVNARLYAHPGRFDELLTIHLPLLWAAWDGAEPAWWFIRFAEPEPHLRVRIELADGDMHGRAVQRVGAWAARMRHGGLLHDIQLGTYHPETGRYGTGDALRAAHAVFAADSQAALAQLAVTRGGAARTEAVTAASLADIVTGFTGSVSQAMGWLAGHRLNGTSTALPRSACREAVRLTDPCGGWAAVRAMPGGDAMLRSWAQRRQALAEYRALLAAGDQPEPDRVLSSLLHMHHVRMIGADPGRERAVRRLARSAALAFAARTAGRQS